MQVHVFGATFPTGCRCGGSHFTGSCHTRCTSGRLTCSPAQQQRTVARNDFLAMSSHSFEFDPFQQPLRRATPSSSDVVRLCPARCYVRACLVIPQRPGCLATTASGGRLRASVRWSKLCNVAACCAIFCSSVSVAERTAAAWGWLVGIVRRRAKLCIAPASLPSYPEPGTPFPKTHRECYHAFLCRRESKLPVERHVVCGAFQMQDSMKKVWHASASTYRMQRMMQFAIDDVHNRDTIERHTPETHTLHGGYCETGERHKSMGNWMSRHARGRCRRWASTPRACQTGPGGASARDCAVSSPVRGCVTGGGQGRCDDRRRRCVPLRYWCPGLTSESLSCADLAALCNLSPGPSQASAASADGGGEGAGDALGPTLMRRLACSRARRMWR